jgi:hypothetical protein
MLRARRLLPATLLLLLAAALLAASALPAAAGPSSRTAALAAKLRTQRLENVRFEDASLPNVLKWLRIATGSNFVLKRSALAKAGIDPDDIRSTLTLERVTPAVLLNLVLEPHDLTAVVKGNVVYVTTRVDALGKPVTRIYAISHITWTKTDFIAPDINLRPSNFTPMDDYESEVVVENDPLSTGDAVAELLQDLVAPGEWDNDGWAIRATDRYLVIRAPAAVQAKVDRALAQIASLK